MSRATDVVRRIALRVGRIPYAGELYARLPSRLRSTASITKENTLEAYDSVYGSQRLVGQYLSRERLDMYRELAALCSPLAPRRVLDVGCGTGHLLRFIVDAADVPPTAIVGVDHSEAGIQRATSLLPSATWLTADLFHLPLESGQFDLVLCTEVLEHLDEPERAVDVLRELCAPRGRVALTVPDGAKDTWEGHVNFWDEDALHDFLAHRDLSRIERIDGGRTLLAWLSPWEVSSGESS